MTIFLVLLVGGFALAAATAMIRGLMAFVQDAEHIRQTGDFRADAYGVKQNRMMSQRVLFQGVAIGLIVLVGALASQK
jgi:Hypoxia induced protein conserved region